MKKCCHCKITKGLTEFTKNRSRKDGLQSECKTCSKDRSKKHYYENQEEMIARSTKYNEEHKDERLAYRNKPEVKQRKEDYDKEYYSIPENAEKREAYLFQYRKDYYAENKEEVKRVAKEYYQTHKEEKAAYSKMRNIRDREKIAVTNKKYRENNPEKIKQIKRDYYHNVDKHDPEYRVIANLRSRLWNFVKAEEGKGHIHELIGCTREFLIKHLESQWTEGMSWETYGAGLDKWQIDHVKPCDSFNLKDLEEQKICFNYKNLQPLWCLDNARKGNKLDFIPSVGV